MHNKIELRVWAWLICFSAALVYCWFVCNWSLFHCCALINEWGIPGQLSTWIKCVSWKGNEVMVRTWPQKCVCVVLNEFSFILVIPNFLFLLSFSETICIFVKIKPLDTIIITYSHADIIGGLWHEHSRMHFE